MSYSPAIQDYMLNLTLMMSIVVFSKKEKFKKIGVFFHINHIPRGIGVSKTAGYLSINHVQYKKELQNNNKIVT